MKLGILFSGGKDSMYAAWLAKKNGYQIGCLISIVSENLDSYMFHTPSIERVKEQAKVMGIPLVIVKTKGEKEKELKDLERAIGQAMKDYGIEGIVSGAVESIYQASRIQKICNKLKIECFNPLWQKNYLELLEDLIKNKFGVIITGVFAYPLGKEFLGKIIDKKMINKLIKLNEKYKISILGEGGELESFVVGGNIFKTSMKIKEKSIEYSNYSGVLELE